VQLHEIHNRIRPQDLELLRRDYTANGGWETFLSYEDPEQDILVGLLRLRKCSEDGTFRKELVGMEGGCSLVRELVSDLTISMSRLTLCSTCTEQPRQSIHGTRRSFNIRCVSCLQTRSSETNQFRASVLF
jgi:hypothetical protein